MLNRIIRRLLVGLVLLAFLGLLCAAGLMGFVYYKETHLPPIGDSDAIIVLGAQVKEDGTPSRKSPFDLFVCVLCVFIVSIFDLNYSVHWTVLFRFIPDVTAFVWLSG